MTKINVSKLLRLEANVELRPDVVATTGYFYDQGDRSSLTDSKPFLFVKLTEDPTDRIEILDVENAAAIKIVKAK